MSVAVAVRGLTTQRREAPKVYVASGEIDFQNVTIRQVAIPDKGGSHKIPDSIVALLRAGYQAIAIATQGKCSCAHNGPILKLRAPKGEICHFCLTCETEVVLR